MGRDGGAQGLGPYLWDHKYLHIELGINENMHYVLSNAAKMTEIFHRVQEISPSEVGGLLGTY